MTKVFWIVQAVKKSDPQEVVIRETWTIGNHETAAKEKAFNSNYEVISIKKLREENCELKSPLRD